MNARLKSGFVVGAVACAILATIAGSFWLQIKFIQWAAG